MRAVRTGEVFRMVYGCPYLAYSLSQQFSTTTEVNSQTKSKAFYNRASLLKQPTVLHGASTEWRCVCVGVRAVL